MKTLAYQAAMAAITLSTLALVSMITVALFETNPLSYPDIPFVTDRQEYAHGDMITFPVRRCSDKSVNISSTQAFVRLDYPTTTPPRYNIVSINSHAEPGCVSLMATPKVIPEYLPAGVYRIELNMAVKGRFKDFVFTNYTVPFMVTSASSEIKR